MTIIKVKPLPATFSKTTDGQETICGLVHIMKDIPTKTGTKKILVSVGDIICKMFGQTAEEFIEKQRNYEGKEAEFYGRWDNSRPGRREFIIDGPHRKPGPVSSCPAANSSLIDSIQQQMYAAMTLNERERKQIAEATSSLTADAGAEPYPQPCSEFHASERSQLVEKAVVGKDPEDGSDVLQGIMRNIKNMPTRSGRVSSRQLKVRAAASISYAYFSFRVTDFLDRPSAPASVQSCS